MAPPVWKLLLVFEEGTKISSPRISSDRCPCRCCWCGKCEVKQDPEEVPFPGLPRLHSFNDNTKQPSWRLVLVFDEGPEFPSPLLQSTVGLCRYCWCEKRRSDQVQESDLRSFRSFFSLEATESLKELLEGKSTDVSNSSLLPTENSQKTSQASTTEYNPEERQEPLSLNDLLKQESKKNLQDTVAKDSDDELFQSASDEEQTSSNDDAEDPSWTQCSESSDDQNHESYYKFQSLKRPNQTSTSNKPYQCDHCPVSFSSSKSLANHTRVHSGEMIQLSKRRFKCDECPSAFKHSNLLQVHKRIHAREKLTGKAKRRYRKNDGLGHKCWCIECDNQFEDNDALYRHLKQEHSRTHPFKCSLCSSRFKKRSDQIIHQRTHRDSKGRYNCSECKVSCEHAIYLRRHILRFHSQNKSSPCNNELEKKEQTSLRQNEPPTLKSSAKIPRKLQSKNPKEPVAAVTETNDCASTVPSTSAQNSDQPDPDILKTTSSKHILQNSPGKGKPSHPFSCSLCKSKFTTKKRKNIHLRKHKDEDGQYECEYCDHSSKLISEMIKHNETHSRHQNDSISGKNPSCDIERTRPEVSSSKQVRPGGGSTLHQCDQCFKKMSSSQGLQKHKLIHTGKRLHRCNQCSKSFTHLHHLSSHKGTHSAHRPFQCDQCSKSYHLSYQLTRHKLTHSGHKPFECNHCSASFHLGWQLTRHQKIHTGEKLVQCDLCSKTVADPFTLRRHQRLVHKMDI